MTTLNFLGFYIGILRLTSGSPLFHRYQVDEYDGECRTSKALFVRLFPFTLTLAFGRWHQTGRTPEEAIEHLMQARHINLYAEDGTLDPRFEAAARENIAREADDPDVEWQILSALGLEQ
jgi:hypothetical protein